MCEAETNRDRAAAQAGSHAHGKQESGDDMQRVNNEALLRGIEKPTHLPCIGTLVSRITTPSTFRLGVTLPKCFLGARLHRAR